MDVDDWALCSLELASGTIGVIEVTRMAAGASEESGFEIYGSQGALIYQESTPNTVRYYNVRRKEWVSGPSGIPRRQANDPSTRSGPTPKYSQGMMTNAHMAAHDLLLNIAENKRSTNDFRSAAQVQQVVGGSLYLGQTGR